MINPKTYTPREGSVAAQVLELLAGGTHTMEELVDASGANEASIRGALLKLRKAGMLTKVPAKYKKTRR